MKKITLYEAGLGLIVAHPSGVVYSNQTMGHFCMQPEIEGVFVPFDAEPTWEKLSAYFEGPKYAGTGAMKGLDREDAGFVDAVIRKALPDCSLVVDRSRLGDSHEAWVHVLIRADGGLFEGFGPYPHPGVLTWPNSD